MVRLLGPFCLIFKSKAFDLVNRDVFFCQTKLSVYFTSEHTMQWFKSYLSDHSQTYVSYWEKHQYRALPLVLGVPLGSILGPLFFAICINDLPLSIQNSETDMYADDTTVWLIK